MKGGIGNSSNDLHFQGSGCGKGYHDPTTPQCGTLSAQLSEAFCNPPSLCEISDWPHWKNLQAEPLIGGRGCGGRAGKLSNLSKNPRLSVVRANFGRSGGKRKLEAKSITNVARWCLQQFPLFTICLCIWCAAL